MIPIILASSLVLKPLFPAETPEAERVKILSSYFDPAPGDIGPIVEKREKIQKQKTPLSIEGHIWVSPPKGHCLIVKTHDDRKDEVVCGRKRLSFQLRDLDNGGRITWLVTQSEDDGGTPLVWQTPYRMANYISPGDFQKAKNKLSPIESCQASYDGIERKITLSFFSGRKLYIAFPPKDKQIAGKRKKANLKVRELTNNKRGKKEVVDSSVGTKELSRREVEQRARLQAQRLSGKKKSQEEKEEYKFLIRPWEAFEMNSSRLIDTGSPQGMNGVCRYRFKGAKFDENSGVIECWRSDSFDAIYAHLSCAEQLPVFIEKTYTE